MGLPLADNRRMNTINQVAQWLRDAQACLARGDLVQAEAMAARIQGSGVAHPAIAAFMAQLERERGDAAAACAWMDRALVMAPDDPRLHLNRAAMRLAALDFAGAATDAGLATRRMPDSFGAWLNLGLALWGLRRAGPALEAFDHALALRPGDPAALQGQARALYADGRANHRSRRLLATVVANDPDDAVSALMYASALADDGLTTESLQAFETLLERHPRFAEAHSSYLIALHYRDDITAERLFDEHLRWARSHQAVSSKALGVARRKDRTLRIGWLSPVFGSGPLAPLVLPVIEALKGMGCEQVLYPSRIRTGAIARRFIDAASQVRELVSGTPEMMAQAIADDQLDVLIDLAGHTPDNRLAVLSHRPAPCQVLWGDYFCTSGTSVMDVFLSDEYLTPEGDERFFSERVIRLSRGRFCYRPPQIVPEPATRPESSGEIVFGCFNRVAKIGDSVLRSWARILEACPGSLLALRAREFTEPAGREHFLERALRAGLQVDRLRLTGAVPYGELMAAYADIDVALDPFPFSGLVTSADALWMGVPVVSLSGATLAGRQTGALLSALRLDDLIAADVDGYVAVAVAVAKDADRRKRLRCTLRPAMADRFDPEPFARELLRTLHDLAS